MSIAGCATDPARSSTTVDAQGPLPYFFTQQCGFRLSPVPVALSHLDFAAAFRIMY